MATENKLDEFKHSVTRNGEELVMTTFPSRVLELDTLCNSEQFRSDRIFPVSLQVRLGTQQTGSVKKRKQEEEQLKPGVKRLRITADSDNNSNSSQDSDEDETLSGGLLPGFPDNYIAPSNSEIVELSQIVRDKLLRLLGEVRQVKLWIQFSIPRIEDGNNFGVEVQEEALGEAAQIEREAIQFSEHFSQYFMMRGKAMLRAGKYPQIRDYVNAIEELDKREYFRIRMVLWEIKNHYATLHDVVTKNIEKIKCPRTNNSASLY